MKRLSCLTPPRGEICPFPACSSYECVALFTSIALLQLIKLRLPLLGE